MFKYMKTYMGFVSGNLCGRDDGYPERKFIVFKNLEELAQSKTLPDEIVYDLHPIDPMDVEYIVKDKRRELEQKEKDQERKEKEAVYEKLKKELGK